MIDNLSNAFLMSAQISRSGKTLNRCHAEGCNDSIAGRARSAIINAQLETGACALMEREQQRLAAPRTRRSQLVRYLRFVRHAVAPNCASRSAPKLRLLGLAGLLRDFSYRARAGPSPTASESVRRLQAGLHSFLSMRRIEA